MKTNKLIIVSLSFATVFSSSISFAKEGDVEARGPLVSLSAESVTVGNLTCTISGNTEFKDENDLKISRSDFVIGDNVKLACRGSLAKELERKRTDDNTGGGDNGGDDNGGGDDSKEVEKELDGKGKAVQGVNTKATAQVEYKYKKDSKNREGIRLQSNLKVPVPSTVPLVSDASAAGSLVLTLTFKRSESDFAECSYVYDGLRTYKTNKQRAEYKIDLKEKKGNFQAKKGACDTDLSQDGVQAGIPSLKRGDQFSISESSAGNILQGIVK